jgi:hypothetical protein
MKVILGIGLSLWLLFSPAYLHFAALDEADFLSSGQAWESADPEWAIGAESRAGGILAGQVLLFSFIFFSILPAHPKKLSAPFRLTRNILGLRC